MNTLFSMAGLLSLIALIERTTYDNKDLYQVKKVTVVEHLHWPQANCAIRLKTKKSPPAATSIFIDSKKGRKPKKLRISCVKVIQLFEIQVSTSMTHYNSMRNRQVRLL